MSLVSILDAIMPLMVGGGNRRADRNVMPVLFLLSAAVLLLSVGVSAVPEEHKPVQELPPQEKATSPHPIGPVVSEDGSNNGNLGFIHAFVASISVIIVSELGDKTFFIAAIMAMRYKPLIHLSCYLAMPQPSSLESTLTMCPPLCSPSSLQRAKLINGTADVEAGTGTALPQGNWHSIISPIFIQALTLTFLAEWGDRSQLTTIILAAREDPFGVAVGGTLGHCLCTGLAVVGGRMIAQKISVRTVTIVGGIVFLAFAFSALFIKPDAGF
ncbi:hypothetical protein F7725_027678 [Dissostichus mawsoni]|uniref:GDT1 family protein n=1 Tax=Dissostichus mawsoni TaxID=36200 RepID=A0A7J5XDN2_DISMA|nr:hypothetical protein F7725_027678 [Dissostichus mawsoni]